LQYFHDTKVHFKKFLERPDKKQALVEVFQADYNGIEDDLRYFPFGCLPNTILIDDCYFRSDPDAKSELHQRSDDLQNKLWEISETRREEADAERIAVIEDKWVEDHFVTLTNIYLTMVQAEVDRYAGTRQLVNDFFKDAYGMVCSYILVDFFKVLILVLR
jgi:hypothetical protein